MSTDLPWVVKLSLAEANALGALRLVPGLQVLEQAEVLWLQGRIFDEALSVRIRSIPDAEQFQLHFDRQLTRWNETVPRAQLPEGEWHPLIEWLKPELPRAGFAAIVEGTVVLKLARSAAIVAANIWHADWQTWRDYAVTAPQIRLTRWSFAVSVSKKVLIRGVPLPPIPGRGLVERDGIAVPSGWRFEPDVSPSVVRQILKLDASEIALFAANGSFERIPDSAFVHATRSAVRLTDGQ